MDELKEKRGKREEGDKKEQKRTASNDTEYQQYCTYVRSTAKGFHSYAVLLSVPCFECWTSNLVFGLIIEALQKFHIPALPHDIETHIYHLSSSI